MNLDMSIVWLRVAAVLYSAGLVHVLLFVQRRTNAAFRPAVGALSAGALLHLVSIVEQANRLGHLPVQTFHQTIGLCGFLMAIVFLAVYRIYEFASLSIFLFPVIFFTTMVAATGVPVQGWTSQGVRDAWLVVHIVLVLGGYVAMVLMAVSSIFYLLQERHLKNKSTDMLFHRLPPLGTLDRLSSRSMAVGFVCLTGGVVAGSLWAYIESGTRWVSEGKVHIALFTWAFYLVMVFLRSTAGWRGRRAAFLALYVLFFSALTWVSHMGLRPLLAR